MTIAVSTRNRSCKKCFSPVNYGRMLCQSCVSSGVLWCCSCKEALPQGSFHNSAIKKRAVSGWCKLCCAKFAAVRNMKISHTDKVRQYRRDYHQRQIAAGTVKRMDKKSMRRYFQKRREVHPTYRLNQNTGRKIRFSLRKVQGGKGASQWRSIFGYAAAELKDHLQSLFSPEMTWENYGTVWHIDHRTPLGYFCIMEAGDSEFRACWGLQNLFPLLASDNRAKGVHSMPLPDRAAQ